MTSLAFQKEPFQQVCIAGVEIDVLGTAHVSQVSADHVVERIESQQYDCVMVELCQRRYQSLTDAQALAKIDLWEMIKQRKAMDIIATLLLQGYQQRLAEQLDIEVGAEIKAAIEYAHKYNLPLRIIDRDIGVTMRRLMRTVRWWEKMLLFGSVLTASLMQPQLSKRDIEELKSSDQLSEMFEDMGFGGKKIKRILIDERDRYMAAKITQAAQEQSFKKAFAVVGAGHLPGITRALTVGVNDTQGELKQLCTVPPRTYWTKVLPWLVVAVILTGFAIGFSQSTTLGIDLAIYWVLINGSLSALGALIARGHYLTVLTAFFAAPLTSLNPTIGAGMVTAFVELAVRKPQVIDFQELRRDIKHWHGWKKNRVARTLLVFFFSTLGSAIGTYLGGIYIFRKVF